MREELQKQIENSFPFMKRNASLEEQRANVGIYDLYGAFGCDVGDGWYSVIYDLCEEVTAAYKKAGADIDIVPVQVKEKFGSLRFYYNFKGQKQAIHAIDFIGRSTFRYFPQNNPLHQEVAEIVRKFEEKSKTVCELCGMQGKLRTQLPWVLTLCDSCYKEKTEGAERK